MTWRALKADGKAMRALRALAASDVALTEKQVYSVARFDELDVSVYHYALATLVRHGYATRDTGVRPQVYRITDTGRAYVRITGGTHVKVADLEAQP